MLRVFLPGLVLMSLAVTSRASVPDLNMSTAATTAPGASVFVLPDGQGAPLSAARLMPGIVVDATITVTLVDSELEPIVGYPREDLWLESACGGLVFPSLGTAPAAGTDVNGQTTWSGAIAGGGCTAPESVIMVMVAGSPLNDQLGLSVNSADMNGDLVVDMHDFAAWAELFGSAEYCGDFNFDGVVDLYDMAIFAGSRESLTPAYALCEYRIGVFFSQDIADPDQWLSGDTNIDYPDGMPFAMHGVAISCPEAVIGYEASIVMDPSFLTIDFELAGAGFVLGTDVDHNVYYDSPRPAIGQIQTVLLSTWTVYPTVPQLASVIRLLPSTSSSNDGQGPGIMIASNLMRANFTPWSHSGCEEDLAPGDFPAAVAPNPFNPTTAVVFEIAMDGEATLSVHDSRGRLVQVLWRGSRSAGRRQVAWNGRDAPSPRLRCSAGATCRASSPRGIMALLAFSEGHVEGVAARRIHHDRPDALGRDLRVCNALLAAGGRLPHPYPVAAAGACHAENVKRAR